MNENNDCPILEFEECVKYISNKTKLEREIIESVLNAETDFMIKLGIIVTDED